MNYLSVCSGIEAATVAWHDLGWKPVAFSEIEKFPSEVLAHRYPGVPNLGDMTKYKEWNFDQSIELVCGGTPCQSFSVAGLRKGLEDPRGNLALTFCGILDKFRPKWFVWENVPGVLSSGGGQDFGSFLGALVELGYGFSYRVLDAQYFGVAQRRRRVFVVGHLGDWRPTAEVLFESESLQRHIKPSRKSRQEAASKPERSTKLRSKSGMIPLLHQDKIDALCARDYKGLNSDSLDKKAIVHVADKCPTITSSASGYSRVGNGTTEHETYVAQAFHASQDPISGEVSPCLGSTSKIGVAYNITFCDANGTRKDRPNGGLYVNETEVSNTMTHAGVGTYQLDMAVRRLTPIECERLQGFPDGYTNIKNNCPDGPRYKALGNSMAVPVMKWIGKRIEAQG
jgi:DNA (cytosine-5)-methyltransferase 1